MDASRFDRVVTVDTANGPSFAEALASINEDTIMAKAPSTPDAPVESDTPVADALDKDVSLQFTIDQMGDVLERAAIDARGRVDDLSIRWGHEDTVAEERTFWVSRDGAETQHDLTVDAAKAALDAIVAPE